MNKISLLKIYILTAAFILSACSSVPRFTSIKKTSQKPNVKKVENKNENTSTYSNYSIIETVEGVASFYADKYHGRTTSNGETYDMYGLTAAHPTYAHNTIIRVVNLSNNKSAIIRVNDRMPKRPDRIIDLSYGTALELDMVNSGITKVRLEILEWGTE